MDKIKAAFAWVKKNRFWLGSVFLALSMIGCWFYAANTIDANTAKYVGEVKSKISAAEGVLKVSAEEGVLVHPNTNTEQGMRELLSQSADEIVKAWKLRYEAQGKILKWPKEILEDKEFCEHFGKHNPPETYPIESERQIGQFSILYLSKIQRQMERICAETLRTKWSFDPKYAKADYRLTPEEALSRFAVVWDESNQQLWHRKLTEFRGYDDHAGSIDGPTGLQIYMLQQDLWLLEAMFEVIREINGDVSANDLAKIKRIDHVVFGREAQGKLGELSPINAGALDSPTTEDGSTGMAGDPPAEGTPFDPSASRKSFHGRYVKSDFSPISADEVLKVLQAVKSGTTLPDSSLELIVAKRVPVRIALNMDEREIPDFMTACANSPFAFEIHQVRKNRHVPGEGIVFNGGNSSQSSGGPMGGGREGMGRDGGREMAGLGGGIGGMGPGMGGMGRGGGGIGGGQGAQLEAAKAIETRTNYDVNVEFYGIVKIYNPVAESYFRKLVGTDSIDAQASINRPKRTPFPRFGALKLAILHPRFANR